MHARSTAPTAATSFIHVDDIWRGLIMGYQSKINGTTVNLGTGSFATVQQVADLISSQQVGGGAG
jgi:nucleoside-diphosphate-sugar epimerase